MIRVQACLNARFTLKHISPPARTMIVHQNHARFNQNHAISPMSPIEIRPRPMIMDKNWMELFLFQAEACLFQPSYQEIAQRDEQLAAWQCRTNIVCATREDYSLLGEECVVVRLERNLVAHLTKHASTHKYTQTQALVSTCWLGELMFPRLAEDSANTNQANEQTGKSKKSSQHVCFWLLLCLELLHSCIKSRTTDYTHTPTMRCACVCVCVCTP